jgi:tRNA modification GTPase
LHIVNKIDLGGMVPACALGVSVLTGEGLDCLRDRLAHEAQRLTEREGPPPLTRARHRSALDEAFSRLRDAGSAILPELRGEDLRLALRAIGRITGEVGIEDLLGDIFGRFCIGK